MTTKNECRMELIFWKGRIALEPMFTGFDDQHPLLTTTLLEQEEFRFGWPQVGVSLGMSLGWTTTNEKKKNHLTQFDHVRKIAIIVLINSIDLVFLK